MTIVERLERRAQEARDRFYGQVDTRLLDEAATLLRQAQAALRWFQWAHAWAGAESWDGTDEMRARFEHASALANAVQPQPDVNELALMGQEYLREAARVHKLLGAKP